MSQPAPAPARPVAGILWMLLTGAQFVAVTAIVKHVGSGIPAPQAAFIRYSLGLVFFLPFLGVIRRASLSRSSIRLFGIRGVAHGIGVMLWFYAMTQIPIAEVTAMNYISPVYVTIGAALFLGERLAIRRILAVCAALVGALIILRPGVREVSPGHLAMLLNAVLFAASYLIAKIMADRLPPIVVVAWLSIIVTVVMTPFAIAVWVPPTGTQIAWLFLTAALATSAHYTMTLAFRAAPIAVTQPVTFLQLVWATALGALVFSEPLDAWVVLGGAIIIGSVSFIAWREAVLKRRAMTPPAVATKV